MPNAMSIGCHSGRSVIVQPDVRRTFFRRFDKSDGCWIWKGSSSSGYGRFNIRGRSELAHRISYVIHKGTIPDGMVVMHTCDNGMCVNPDHLVIGTQADNLADMRRKGRAGRSLVRTPKSHCIRGHRFAGENVETYTYHGTTRRACLTCRRYHSECQKALGIAKRRREAMDQMSSYVREALPSAFGDLVAITDLRRADIFCSNYGVFGHEPQTLTRLGERYGITRERARQLCNDVLRVLGIDPHTRKTAHAA